MIEGTFPRWREWYRTTELRWHSYRDSGHVHVKLQQRWKRNRVDYDGLRDIVLAVEEEWRDVPSG